MDVSLAATTLNLLGDLRRRLGMAMLFVTHDLAAARIIADRIAVLHDGELVEVGDPDTLIAAPRPLTLARSSPPCRASMRDSVDDPHAGLESLPARPASTGASFSAGPAGFKASALSGYPSSR